MKFLCMQECATIVVDKDICLGIVAVQEGGSVIAVASMAIWLVVALRLKMCATTVASQTMSSRIAQTHPP